MPDQALVVAVAAGLLLVALLVAAFTVRSWYRRVPEGRALVVSKPGGSRTAVFSGGAVVPFLSSAEEMDLTIRTVIVERMGRDAFSTKDGARVDFRGLFHLRVNPTIEDVLRVADRMGPSGANDRARVDAYFEPMFREAAKVVFARFDAAEVAPKHMVLKDEIISVVGMDLNGFRLDDVILDHVEVRGG